MKRGQSLLLKISGSFGERGIEALEIDPLRWAKMLFSLMFSMSEKNCIRKGCKYVARNVNYDE